MVSLCAVCAFNCDAAERVLTCSEFTAPMRAPCDAHNEDAGDWCSECEPGNCPTARARAAERRFWRD